MRTVVIGAGHAAGNFGHELRQQGWDGDVVIVGEQNYPPYQHPPLSKKLLAGEVPVDEIFLYGDQAYRELDIELRLGTRAVDVDTRASTVALSTGDQLDYDYLVFATGARSRKPDVPGADLKGIHYLRSIDDALCLHGDLKKGGHLVVVGGGYIGMEVAAVARQLGMAVTVLEFADRVMSRVVAAPVAQFLERLHAGHGVDVRTGVRVEGFVGSDTVQAVATSVGNVPCDVVVVGVGVCPETSLAEGCGIHVDDGIVVDEYTRTNIESIFAMGDCTRHPSPLYGTDLRLECVQNAVDQSAATAKAIAGASVAYDTVPWFWSEQYDTLLQIAGISSGFDNIVLRGSPGDGPFSVFYLRDGVVIAVDAINSARAFMVGKTLIRRRARLAPEAIADLGNSEKSLLARVVI